MVASIVVVADEGDDGRLQIFEYLVGKLVHVSLQGLVAALQLAVGLGVEGAGEDMPDAHHVQVVPEVPRHETRTIVAEQAGPFRDWDLVHTCFVHPILYQLYEGVGGHVNSDKYSCRQEYLSPISRAKQLGYQMVPLNVDERLGLGAPASARPVASSCISHGTGPGKPGSHVP